MEIQDFITSVLLQLEGGLKAATSKSDQKSFTFYDKINFDLAVTYTNSKEGSADAKGKGGIKIVDFEVNGHGKVSSGQEIVQRIKFSVAPSSKDDDRASYGSAIVETGALNYGGDY